MYTPDSNLRFMLGDLITATSRQAGLRQTAVRWFNRLYQDVRKWDHSLRELLRGYPGVNAPKDEKQAFASRLRQFEESLRDPHSATKNELLARLQILAARFDSDFAWLKTDNSRAFHDVRRMIDDGYACEDGLIWMALNVVGNLRSRIEWNLNEDFRSQGYVIEDGDAVKHEGNCTHIAPIPTEQEVTKAIRQYEKSADINLQHLHDLATNAGITLVDITEYDAALSEDVTPRIEFRTGDIDMSQDKVHIHNVVGPVNVKSHLERVTQVVRNAPALSEPKKEELSALIEELMQALESVRDAQPEDTHRVAQAAEMVVAEVAKEKPNQSFLRITTQGLIEAAKAIQAIAPPVLSIASRIAAFAAGLF